MKKPLSSLLFCAGAILWSDISPAYIPLELETLDSDFSLGSLAKFSDVVAIGVVQEGEAPIMLPTGKEQSGYFILKVEQPIVGCVSNQEIRVHAKYHMHVDEPPISLLQTDPDEYYKELNYYKYYISAVPTNNVRIVIGVSTNQYNRNSYECRNWNILKENTTLSYIYWGDPPPAQQNPPIFKRDWESTSWWYDTPENAAMTAYLSNAVFCIQMERNWTNYYALCRDGYNGPPGRIHEDAKADIVNLFYSSSDEQLQHIEDDPLLPAPFKQPYIDFLRANPVYRFPPYRHSDRTQDLQWLLEQNSDP